MAYEGQLYSFTNVTGTGANNVYMNDAAWYTLPHPVKTIIPSPIDNAIVIIARHNTDPEQWVIVKRYINTNESAWEIGSENREHIRMPGNEYAWRHKSDTGKQRIAWVNNNNTITTLNFLSGQLDVIEHNTTVTSTNRIYDAYTHSFFYVANPGSLDSIVYQYKILDPQTENIALADFLRNVAVMRGYAPDKITVTNIDDTIIGAAITNVTDIDSMLEDVRLAYNFEIIKKGDRIRFVRKKFGDEFEVDYIVTADDLAPLSSDGTEQVLVTSETRAREQIPGVIRLKFIDPEHLYSVNEYMHKRNSSDVDLTVERVLNLPIIMYTDTAAALAQRMILQEAKSSTEYTFRLPPKYIPMEAGDTIELVTDEYAETVRVVEVAYNGDWSQTVKAEGLYTDIKIAFDYEELPQPEELPPLLVGEASPLIVDTTFLAPGSASSQMVTYLGVAQAGRIALAGPSLIGRVEADGRITSVATLDNPTVCGYVSGGGLSNTAEVMRYNRDEVLKVAVLFGDGSEYQTDTLANVLAGSNRLLVGNTGRWEQIGFVNASYDADKKIATLTGLIRGLRGTEVFANTHTVSDYVIPLRNFNLTEVVNKVSDLGDVVTYAVGDISGRVAIEQAGSGTVYGNTLRPWAPANPKATASGGDIVLAWQRRTRVSGPWNNGSATVPLDEASEAYDVEIRQAGAVIRTVSGLSSPTYTYTAAQQSADGFTGGNRIEFTVYQISAKVGRGFAKTGVYDVV
jgi:hypothetical protein